VLGLAGGRHRADRGCGMNATFYGWLILLLIVLFIFLLGQRPDEW
jgi:hypothetical protein